ncbi:VOC family protein [Heyndrickxia sporothermodurans]|uniref:VOC family protein n=1 Tax=Heyndrickxia sporothermodurans TaxID=46224 RepID=A0AB37HAP7_9BACI|nr:VOC family protein [Heyndrickxia sporothermodurans]MBL5783652.1 VOC family protein [Heyndrickxia sporothermodurans]MBL5797742.1 VOC family protein [Heyndrickxia sporothermodurans]MBL5805059.1 VOC family protein [Heyndrickxia sporothermodurans]MBL5808709.1 VOC family protein [Heyndrickxia sporothermodurans]MBL5833095.1 VOC family protein [Heyndrickxia sporothermodurans]
MSVDVYLNFNGNCREAVEFYAKVFNTEEPRIMTFGEAPPNPEFPLPEEAKNLVMHARLSISGSNVMFSDTFPGTPFVVGNNISLAIVSQNQDEITSYYNQLKEGGKVNMELQETFWSKCYGQVVDKFGVEWQLSYDNGESGW